MIQKFLFRDSSGKKSLTATVFIWGAAVVNIKLALSGLVVLGTKFPDFTGGDYGMALAALGGIYVMRRSTEQVARGDVNG